MHAQTHTARAKAAGLLYLLIIVLGLSSEILLRGPLFHESDPAATAAAILGAEGLLRLSVLADMAMATADVALAVLLLWLFRPVDPLLAALAVAFRLAQAAVIAANLLNLHGALLVLTTPGLAPDTAAAIAYGSLDLHRHGYDLGLVFFGVNALLMGVLILRSTGFPGWLGHLMAAAGIVYLAGSTLRFAAPDLALLFQPAYLVAVVAELSFAVLLLKGRVIGKVQLAQHALCRASSATPPLYSAEDDEVFPTKDLSRSSRSPCAACSTLPSGQSAGVRSDEQIERGMQQA